MRTAGAFIGSAVDKPERQIYNLEDYLFLDITCSPGFEQFSSSE
jgi:hypothetical protein